jgi:hypothetical protein
MIKENGLLNMKKRLSLIILITILATISVNALSTQQQNTINLNPYYRESMSAGTAYNYSIAINPPDGFSSTISAMINFNAQINGQSQNFTLLVNNKSCNPSSYYIPTAYSTTGNVQFGFDCSNQITSAGTYNITLKSSVNTGSISGYLDLTYMNNPEASIKVFGTEYQVNDSGKMFTMLLSDQNIAINDATCYGTVYYPNGQVWLNKSLMTYQTGSNGLYYLDLTIPSTLGVYMTEVECNYVTASNNYYPATYSINKGTYNSGNLVSLTVVDYNYFSITETGAILTGGNALLLHATLDELSGNISYDSSQFANNGINFNNPVQGVSGTQATAYRYSGSTDYTKFNGTSNYFWNSTDEILTCFSMNQTIHNNNGNEIIDAYVGGTTEGWDLNFQSTDQIRFRTDRTGSGGKNVDTPLTYVDGKWHTFCAYANFTTLQIFVDGALAVTNDGQNQAGSMNVTSHGFYLGTDESLSPNANISLDEVCILKGRFTNLSNIAKNYNTTKSCPATFSSGQSLETTFAIFNISYNTTVASSTLSTAYKWSDSSGEVVNIYLYNYTGAKYYKLPTSLIYTTGDIMISNTLTNLSDFISNNTMIILMNDSEPNGTMAGQLSLNLLQLQQVGYLSQPIKYIRGGGELHVSNYANELKYLLSNLSVTLNITGILDEIAKSRNLSTEEYNNLTIMLNNLQNNSNNQFANLTIMLDNLLNNSNNLSAQITALNNLMLSLNATTNNIQMQIQELNYTINTQFNITNSNINNVLNNLTGQMNYLNQSINSQITISENKIINTIIMMNASITAQMNALNASLTAQLINLNNQLLSNTNLTTEQYNNLTIQIANIANQINFTPINLQLAELNLSLSALQNTANTILNAQNQMNNTINNIYTDLITLNNTMFVQFGITNALIQETYNNLTQQIANLNFTIDLTSIQANLTNLQNITLENQNWLTQIWNYLQGLANNIVGINQTTITNQQILLQLLNQTANQTTQILLIYPTTNNCVTGSNWNLQAKTTNEFNTLQTNNQINCNTTNDVTGTNAMIYNPTIELWTYTMTCPASQVWNWTITCQYN